MLTRRGTSSPAPPDHGSVLAAALSEVGFDSAVIGALIEPANARSLAAAVRAALTEARVQLFIIAPEIDLDGLLADPRQLQSWRFEPPSYAVAVTQALRRAVEAPAIPPEVRTVLQDGCTRLDPAAHLRPVLRLASFLFAQLLAVDHLEIQDEEDVWRLRFGVESGDLGAHLADLGLQLGPRQDYNHFHLTRKTRYVEAELPGSAVVLPAQQPRRSSYVESWDHPISYQGQELGSLHVGIDTDTDDRHGQSVDLAIPKTEAALFEALRTRIGA